MERFLGGIAELVHRRPYAVLLGLAVATALLGAGLPRVRVAYDPLSLLPDHPQVRAFQEIDEGFSVGGFSHLIAVRFAPRPGFRIDDPQAVLEMEGVLATLRGLSGIVSAEGVPDFIKFVHQELHGGQRRFHTLPSEGCELGYSFQDVIRMAFQRMAMLKRFISLQGTALVTAQIARDAQLIEVARRVDEALAPLQREAQATELAFASYGATLDVFNRATQRDLQRLIPAIFALIVVVLTWVFRLTRPRALAAAGAAVVLVAGLVFAPELLPPNWIPAWEVAGSFLLLGIVLTTLRSLGSLYLPLAVVAVAGIWVFGAMGWLGVPLTFLMVAVVPLLLGVGIDDAIHLLHRYEEERCKKQEGPEAMGTALRRTGRALLLTTLTTTAGFAALLTVPSPPLRWFGLLAALSMLSAFVGAMLLIPTVKQLLREGPRAEPWPPRGGVRPLVRAWGHPGESAIGRGLRSYARCWGGHRGVAVLVLLAAAGLGLAGYWEGHAFQTYTIDYRKMLPTEHPISRLYTQINREFRPYDEVLVRLRGELARLNVMRLLLTELPTALAASPYAHKVTSIAHILEDVRAANAELGQGFLTRFSEDPDEAYGWLLDQAFAREGLRERAAAYARHLPDGSTEAVVRVNVMRFADQAGIERVTEDMLSRLEPVLEEFARLDVEAQVTGTPFLEAIGLATLRRSLIQSLILSLILCFGLLATLLRSLLWGALALFPVVLVMGGVLGSLNLLHLELNAATTVVAALGIGLGIDYAIHLINRFREERDLGRALARTGEALTAAFFTTAAAFFLMLLSAITWNRDFGTLVGLAITYAFGATIFFLTPLLALSAPTPTGRPARFVGRASRSARTEQLPRKEGSS